MLKISDDDNRISLSREFFCDGHCYLLTSASFGESGLTAGEISEILFSRDDVKTAELLEKGICLPVCFPGDCALDGNTLFVLGDLNEREERDWIARLSGKLNIPCGKLVLACGWADDELEHAVSGAPPDENYVIFEVVEVPPAVYSVEIYAYFSSQTVQVALSERDENGNSRDNDEREKWYRENRPGIENVGYIIRLAPLREEPPLPKLENGWATGFDFRR